MTRTVYDILTAAFQDDPVVGWLFPDPDERRRLQPHYFAGLLLHPGAETNEPDEGGGAAVWLALPAGRVPFDRLLGGSGPDPLAVFGENSDHLVALGSLLADRHPHHGAHVYLACLGVLPARRGAGLGSTLLRRRLNRADAEATPAYLEASSARSRELYLRHGFEDLGEPLHLPDAGPTLWPMWRTPTHHRNAQ